MKVRKLGKLDDVPGDEDTYFLKLGAGSSYIRLADAVPLDRGDSVRVSYRYRLE